MTMVPLTCARAFYFWVYCESFFCWITYPWWLLGYGYCCLIVVLMLFIALYVCIVFVYSYIVFVSLLVFRCYMLFCWLRFVVCHVFICPVNPWKYWRSKNILTFFVTFCPRI